MSAANGLLNSLSESPFSGDRVRALFKFNDISPEVQTHLLRVYFTLFLSLATCAAGTLFDLRYGVDGRLVNFVSFVLLFATILDSNRERKFFSFLGFSFLSGISLGSLVAMALDLNPALPFTALLFTSAIFLCFSLSALVSNKRSYLFLGGILSSSLSAMLLFSFFSTLFSPFFPSLAVIDFKMELYLGLLVFCGYVLYDTQIIIFKRERGDTDVVLHALELFLDFFAIFVRILIILTQKEEKDKKKKERK